MIFSGCHMATNGIAAKKPQKLHESNNSFYSRPNQKMQKPTIVHNPRARVIVTAANTEATGLWWYETRPHVCPWKKWHNVTPIHPAVVYDLTPRSGPHVSTVPADTVCLSVCLSYCHCKQPHAIKPNISSHPPRLNPWIGGEVNRRP